jgi:hypothetical protein
MAASRFLLSGSHRSLMLRTRRTMGESTGPTGLMEGLSPSESGVGPLLERDYWAVIEGTRLRPSEVMTHVKAHFASFAPGELAAFSEVERPLRLGDELDIRIAAAGRCRVRVVHCDDLSVTVATLRGHPEAGRITFGAYRNRDGQVIFHIRSHARSDSLLRLLGFRIAGEAMQTNTWAAFVNRVAAVAGGRVQGFVHADTRTIPDEDDGPLDQPTYLARGD